MRSHMTSGVRISLLPDPPGVSKDTIARFQQASLGRARWQVVNSFGPYLLLWVAMVYALSVSYWIMLPLAILAAGFLARIFIIFHDCGHASFFKSKRANNALAVIAGLLNLLPIGIGAGSTRCTTGPRVTWIAAAPAIFGL